MEIENIICAKVIEAVDNCFGVQVDNKSVQIQETRKDFEGHITLVVFPFTRFSKCSPEQTAEKIGEYLNSNLDIVTGFNVVKGFLNISISSKYWLSEMSKMLHTDKYGYNMTANSRTLMIEYSSPNTNKPLHLGHIRNNLLGWSLAELMKANGYKIYKVNLVNDRGIHICKSMVAWQMYADGQTPETIGKKGDHFVGDYYVKFDKEYKKQVRELIESGVKEEVAKKDAPIMLKAQEMLRKWESGDNEVVALWKKMNTWVLDGFDETYKLMGVDFDKIYFESETYKKGRDIILKGLEEGVLYKKEDGSIWADLTDEGLDHKLLLRADGTSVYMTQDIGTAYERFKEFDIDEEIYVVGNEQNYHFQVLSIICRRLGFEWADKIRHLSYGMVELPEGKMKSREGTVVDADDLMNEMILTARKTSMELGKLDGYTEEEANDVYRKVALGALKYFILKVDPKKTMLFNPKDSIDFNGNTGPFIQYTYARIQSVLRKAEYKLDGALFKNDTDISPKENDLAISVLKLPSVVLEAGRNYSPAIIANYAYDLSKEFNQFYHDFSILGVDDKNLKYFRLSLSYACGVAIANAMGILGIEMPERM